MKRVSLNAEILRRVFQMLLLNGVAAVPILVILYGFAFPEFEAKFIESRKLGAQTMVEVACRALDDYDQMARAGEMPLEEAKREALDLIGMLRNDQNGYVTVSDLDYVILKNTAFPELIGLDASDGETIPANTTNYKIALAKFITWHAVDLARKKSSDFKEYSWPKPGTAEFVRKLTYYKLYPQWGWIVAHGVYLDDVEQEMRKFRTALITSLGFAVLLSILISVQFVRKPRKAS